MLIAFGSRRDVLVRLFPRSSRMAADPTVRRAVEVLEELGEARSRDGQVSLIVVVSQGGTGKPVRRPFFFSRNLLISLRRSKCSTAPLLPCRNLPSSKFRTRRPAL